MRTENSSRKKKALCHLDMVKYHDDLQASSFMNDTFQFSGIRRCPGEDLANIEMFLVLANLLKAFVFRTPENDDNSVGTYYKTGTGVLRNPKPYYVVLENRS